MTEPSVFTSYCPRCDRAGVGDTKAKADAVVRAHLARNDDDLHANALEEWDDDATN